MLALSEGSMATKKKAKASAKAKTGGKKKARANAKKTKAVAKTQVKTKAAVARGASKPRAASSKGKKQRSLSDVEKEVQQLIDDNDAGNIDNVFDHLGDMYEIDKKLPKTSKLRPAFDQLFTEFVEIAQEVS